MGSDPIWQFQQPRANVLLAPLTTLGIGGPARWTTRAASVDDVAAAHEWAEERSLPLFVLGGGSNLVVADEGFDGLVLQVAVTGVTTAQRGEDLILSAGAGESWDGLVAFVVQRGLAGVECLSGIPGTVGGTPIQNVGAYGQEVASVIESVIAFDRNERRSVVLSTADCEFAYRMSRFKARDAGRFVVCEVTFRLRAGAPTITYPDVVAHLSQQGVKSAAVRDVREAVLSVRRRKGMVIDAADPDTRSVGSFFMNPVIDRAVFIRIDGNPPHYMMDNDTVKIPAAWLIERSGFGRGHADGAVGLSTKHPLAIINRGGATARDVVRFARRIKSAVLDRFGIVLRPEPVFVGFNDDPDVQYLRG
jgi:UDP-N-acetylmuramate dehydrogenase